MQSLYLSIRRFSDILVWILEAVSTLALMFIVFSFGWLVFGRYVLNATPTWVEHVTILLITLITFTMMAVNQRRGTNLAVGVFTDRLSPKLQACVLAFVDCLVALFGLVCAVYGARLYVFNAGLRMPILGISEGIRMIPLIFGGGVLALVSLVNAAERFINPRASQQADQQNGPELDASKLDLGGQ